MKTRLMASGVALMLALPIAALAQASSQFQTFDALAAHYLQERQWIAPLIPPLLPSSLETLEAMILKSDYSFQDLDGWYFPWNDGPYDAGGELASYDEQTLIVYEDLSAAAIRICTSDGKTVAEFKSEPFPYLSALKGDEYDRAILAELNRRSVTLWISFQNSTASSPTAFGASPSAVGGGYSMMSMGGSAELEVIEFQ